MNYIAVVEDSAQDRAVLDSYLEKYQQEKNCHFQITHFSDGDEIALGYKGGYDLILMDIEMTFMDGMSAAEEIRRADPEVLIIFITNSPQYAIKGYAVQALDYILKPLSYYAFCQRMNHVRELLGRRQKHFLTVPCAGGVQKLDVSDIYYVEICDHDLLFHTKQGRGAFHRLHARCGAEAAAGEFLPQQQGVPCQFGARGRHPGRGRHRQR